MNASLPISGLLGQRHLPFDTQGIKYAGSKLKIIPYILDIAREVEPTTVLDGFSGTTRVSQAFAQHGYDVTCADLSVWSKVMGTCYLKADMPERYEPLIKHLNAVPPKDGWFTANYGGEIQNNSGKKFPWQKHNTRKLDGIREEIDNLNLPEIDKCVALTSLMLGLDKVDNTLGHFASYLKDWSPRSFNDLRLEVPKITVSSGNHEIIQGDILGKSLNREFDLAYLDPPYGSNNEKMPPSRVRYASYYHIWTTICLNDRPSLFGAAGRREDTRDAVSASVFEEFRKSADGKYIAVSAIRNLLNTINSKRIILSYSSGGRATADELRDVIDEVGRLIDVRQVSYRRNVMAGMRWTNDWVRASDEKNIEFLFHIEKKK